MINLFPSLKQQDQNDCGPTCLKMICKYYEVNVSIEYLRELSYVTYYGTSMLSLSRSAEQLGFRTISSKLTLKNFIKNFSLPTIIHWKQHHFIVVYKIKKNKIYVSDPAIGKITYDIDSFLDGWSGEQNIDSIGFVLFIEATPDIYENERGEKGISFSYFLGYFKGFKKQYVQIVLGMIASMLITFVTPFITQSIVDVGINGRNMGFINLMLIAQLVLASSSIIIGFIQNWLFMHMGTRISLSIATGYISKVMKLSIPYLERKTIGDFMQRMSDNSRIQGFISSSTLSTLFSFLNVIVFGIIMATFDLKILAVFLLGSTLYAGWILLFIKKRKEYDYKKFDQNSQSQTSIIQIFNGIRDIKLYNFEQEKRWEWERIQSRGYLLSMKQLGLNQVQQSGAFFIENAKNITITYLVVSSVISGQITFGTMISIQYILGQMGSPLLQLIGFINSYQDAKISLQRIGEIHTQANEEADEENEDKIHNPHAIKNKSIEFQNVTFSYNKLVEEPILKNVDIHIPEGKFTAVVGESGSGKTTLIKILLGFYKINRGSVKIGELDLSNLSAKMWRDQCGAVLQDSYLFSCSILDNIALNSENVQMEKVYEAARLANIHDFITSLPLAYKTKIGENGLTLSQGQKQRIFIARIIYKDPGFLFFDEATNALDSENESTIMKNISEKLGGKTIIFVSHRLSAIKRADNIIVMKDGEVAESGKHNDLMKSKGIYYMLNKKQL